MTDQQPPHQTDDTPTFDAASTNGETATGSQPAPGVNDGEGLEIADPKDFEIQRDADGELLPVTQRIPGTNKAIRVIPPAAGDVEEYADVLQGRDESSARQAEVLRTFIVEGPGADADEEYVDERLRGFVLGGLLTAIRNAAGYDVHLGNQEQQMAEVQAMSDLDPETMDLLSQFADDTSVSR